MKKIFFLLCLVAISCTSTYDEHSMYQHFDTSPLVGMVYDLENRPVANLSITFFPEDEIDESFLTVTTDVNGRFSLVLKRGMHYFETYHLNYLDVEDQIHFTSRGQILYIKVKSINQVLHLVEEALQKERLEDAKNLLDEIQEDTTKNSLYFFYLATYHYMNQEYNLAIKALEQARSISRDPSIVRFLIKIHKILGNTQEVKNLELLLMVLTE